MRSAFVIGGTGLVGRALIDALRADGVEVIALARTPAAIRELREAGVEPLPTDLAGAWTWSDEIAEAEVVFHAGLPRLRPPLRRLGAHRRARANGFSSNDEGSLVLALGEKVATVPGDRTNIKITYPEDAAIAEAILGGAG